jgi:transposase
MSEGGRAAIQADDDVVAAGRLRELEGRIRDLERLLGRKTMEVEILREALSATQGKSLPGSCRRHHQAVPDEARGRQSRCGMLQPDRAAPRQRKAPGRLPAPRG